MARLAHPLGIINARAGTENPSALLVLGTLGELSRSRPGYRTAHQSQAELGTHGPGRPLPSAKTLADASPRSRRAGHRSNSKQETARKAPNRAENSRNIQNMQTIARPLPSASLGSVCSISKAACLRKHSERKAGRGPFRRAPAARAEGRVLAHCRWRGSASVGRLRADTGDRPGIGLGTTSGTNLALHRQYAHVF